MYGVLRFILGYKKELAILIATAAVIGGLVAFGYSRGADSVQREWDAEKKKMAEDTITQQSEFRVLEHSWLEDLERIDYELQSGTKETRDTADATIADMHNGNLQLRDKFTGCNQGGMPQAPAAPSGNNGGGKSGLSNDDQELLIRLAERADRIVKKLTACQDYAKSIIRKN